MEDLLASIRKAIHDDIGDGRSSERLPAPLQAAPTPRAADELSAAASEIQQLRERISRARTVKSQAPVEPGQRAASLAAALQNETPRRNWRELEPPPAPRLRELDPPAPRLRGAVLDNESPRPQIGHEVHAAPAARLPARSEPSVMLSGNAAQAVQSAFGKLTNSVTSRNANERSVEQVSRELLRVMLKQWLDENLPAMVERLVREEIERVVRPGR
ncbi:MAG: DUF2497 domain-containing protein [Aestuariivirga sp.]|uniref:DUF2497 domain-containing protein n=1 Tax=Aestuariivirga sp. TaxID=2650926 RepID=UPI0025B7C270|nr:DUF2497 domain-containing protein [Aestuariivirga sp.]MCA3560296.1 DUF2497 domain-containing protein [Aestuariivirga sp.]